MENLSNLPPPLTPVDCDLRAFPFMPLDVVRLRDSDISAISSGDEFRCAVLLWCAAWHQVPAGSLPDDDIVLAQFAGFGRVVKEWKKVRKGALRGWFKCSDGRLYHHVVAEKAVDAWARRAKHQEKKEADRVRLAEKRASEKQKPAPAQQNKAVDNSQIGELSRRHLQFVAATNDKGKAINGTSSGDSGLTGAGTGTGIGTQQQPGGSCESQVGQEPDSQAQGLRLSEVLGLAWLTHEQAHQLDELAKGASIEQMELLKFAHAHAKAGGNLKNEMGWLVKMSKKAASGAVTALQADGGGGVAVSMHDELKALAVPVGTVISVGDKQLTVDHIDGVPRVLDSGLWIGAQRTLKVLQRVQTGELSAVASVAT